MGQNIAGTKQRDHPRQDRVDVFTVGAALGQAPQLSEMHIDRKLRATPDLGRHLDDADTPARKAADLGMRLDATNEVAIGGCRFHGGIDIDAVGAVKIGVIVSFQASNQIGRQKGIGARQRFLRDEVPKPRQGHAGRSALIDQRGHP